MLPSPFKKPLPPPSQQLKVRPLPSTSCVSPSFGIEKLDSEMALEAVVFPHHLLGCTLKDLYGLVEEDELQAFHGNWEASCTSVEQGFQELNACSLLPARKMDSDMTAQKEVDVAAAAEASSGRKKRRRSKTLKNREEMEKQRMTHIAVERNRRKQMNQYLSMLRSLMPPTYVSKSDQASIIGGAIDFVKELEQVLQSLEVQKQLKQQAETGEQPFSNPLSSFFISPQHSSTSANNSNAAAASVLADIEVAMAESHANLKMLSRRRPRQLLKLVVGLQNLQLTTLHLNVITVEPMVLYSLSLKVEDDCRLSSGDDIAAAVHEIVVKIEEDAGILLR